MYDRIENSDLFQRQQKKCAKSENSVSIKDVIGKNPLLIDDDDVHVNEQKSAPVDIISDNENGKTVGSKDETDMISPRNLLKTIYFIHL